MDTTRILAVVAHADDETLGAGGLLTEHNKDSFIQLAVSDRIKIAQKLYKHVESYEYLDQTLDVQLISDLITRIKATISVINPTLILTHSTHELNRDHAIITEAVKVATRDYIGTVLGMCVLSSTINFTPTVFYPLSAKLLEVKLWHYARYKTEVKPIRSVDAAKALAIVHGALVPTKYAEGFECIKTLI